MANTEENPLLVFEYGGTGRGGKGSIVTDIADGDPTIAADETGADYRALTRVLIDEGQIEFGMPSEVVAARVGRIAVPAITSTVARRHELVASRGLGSLYEADVNGLVPDVSPIATVRKAVKDGFIQRVAAIVDDDEHDILLVDGRNLAPVMAALPAAELVARTFVSCLAIEGAMREVTRNGQEEDPKALKDAYEAIGKRNTKDAKRTVDPVRPDEDAINYWPNGDLFTHSLQRVAEMVYGNSSAYPAVETLVGLRGHRDFIRRGVGAQAVLTGRQINFDTTPFRAYSGKPKEWMLQAAHVMFDEALVAHAAVVGSNSRSRSGSVV